MSRQLVIGMLFGFCAAVALLSWAPWQSKPTRVEAPVATVDAGRQFVPYARTQIPEKLMVQLKPLMFAGVNGGS